MRCGRIDSPRLHPAFDVQGELPTQKQILGSIDGLERNTDRTSEVSRQSAGSGFRRPKPLINHATMLADLVAIAVSSYERNYCGPQLPPTKTKRPPADRECMSDRIVRIDGVHIAVAIDRIGRRCRRVYREGGRRDRRCEAECGSAPGSLTLMVITRSSRSNRSSAAARYGRERRARPSFRDSATAPAPVGQIVGEDRDIEGTESRAGPRQ